MNGKNIIIILIILGFAGLAFYSIQGVLTPYVSFAEAIQSGSSVQVIGKLDRTKAVRHGDGFYTFSLKDEGNTAIDVLHRGPMPFNFDHSDKIVALGSYNRETRIFEADKVLVNCPSKYQKQQPGR